MKYEIKSFNIFLELTRRHFIVFFKNTIRVFYTLMVPVIILLVYVLFLRDLELSTVNNTLLENGVNVTEDGAKSVATLVDAWFLSGIVASSTITISIQTNNIIVNDKENGVNRDFISSPIKKSSIVASYFLFNYVVTVFLCLVVMIISLIYLAAMGEFVYTFVDILLMIGILLFISILSTLFTIFVCSFIERESTLASVIAVFSAAAGFLIGAYMPLAIFPEWVSGLCVFIPGTELVSLMRFAFLSTPIDNVYSVINRSILDEVVNNYGYNINFFGYKLGPDIQTYINLGYIVVFGGLTAISAKFLSKTGGKN